MFNTLVKFIHRLFHHYHIKDADILPTSIFTAKSSLGFSMKYCEYAMCLQCYTLYNSTDLKNYTEDDQSTVKKCHHVKFSLHQSKMRWLPCGKALTQEIVTQKGYLFCPISVYPVGSIKQQLYMMYQQLNFEQMLCHLAVWSISEGLFSDIYAGKIWQTFSIDPAIPVVFCTTNSW